SFGLSRRQLGIASHANVNQNGDQLPLPQHEILRRLRRSEEHSHRRYIWWLALGPFARIERMTLDNLLDCCNKAAPVYLLEGAADLGPNRFPGNMFQYIYRRWFVPYKRNLEYNQYLVTFLRARIPEWVQAKPRRFLNQIVDLNASICAKVKKTQLELVGGKPDDVLDLILRTSRYRYRFDSRLLATPLERLARARLEQEFFCLQPLFRAMAIVRTTGHQYQSRENVIGDGDIIDPGAGEPGGRGVRSPAGPGAVQRGTGSSGSLRAL
ncbi:hypothetical protein TOPH_06686, partial [Tolypocladium ophioglossoides CBS 100239]